MSSIETYQLPPIREMYNCIRENHNYSVQRTYFQHESKNQSKPQMLKKGHYLDKEIKANCSPGPANKSNLLTQWKNNNKTQLKWANRKTFIEQLQRLENKKCTISPNSYSIQMEWPKKAEKSIRHADRINFTDDSQYQAAKSPGPGSYSITEKLGCKVSERKFQPHQSRKPKDLKAGMSTLNPCPNNYSTFQRTELFPPKKNNLSSPTKKKLNTKESKENVPGPGTYQMINTWGSDKKDRGDLSAYMKSITKGPNLSSSVYYS